MSAPGGESVRSASRRSQLPAWHRRIEAYLSISDTLVVVSCLLVAQTVRFGADSLLGREIVVAAGWVEMPYWVIGAGIAMLWLVALAATKSRRPHILTAGMLEYQRVLNSTFFTFGVTAIVAYLFQVDVSRGYFLVALPLGAAGLVASRWVWRQYLDHARRRSRYQDRALIIGRRVDVETIRRELGRSRPSALRPVASCHLDEGHGQEQGQAEPAGPSHVAEPGDPSGPDHLLEPLAMVGRADVLDRARSGDVDVVVVAGDLPGGREAVRRLAWELEGTHAELVVASRLMDIAGPRIHIRPVEGVPLVYLTLPRYTGVAYAAKRVLDVAVSLVALIPLAVATLIVTIAVKLDDGGPVFFVQQRIGTHGKPFRMLKFRSMEIGAELRKAELLEHDEGAGVLFKVREDPRVTRVGAVLRGYSLDELPQFLNVLHGSMSVVGPRPPLPEEVEQYDAGVRRRLLIKPGITGLWQVSGRSDLSWEESVRLDLTYVENWSITQDVVLIVRTAMMMLSQRGAY